MRPTVSKQEQLGEGECGAEDVMVLCLLLVLKSGMLGRSEKQDLQAFSAPSFLEEGPKHFNDAISTLSPLLFFLVRMTGRK